MTRLFLFPKSLRLLARRDFFMPAYQKKSYKGPLLVIEARKNKRDTTRLGITVTRKFGKAVIRNRFKRLVREAFRLNKEQIPIGYDIVVKPTAYAQFASLREIEGELCAIDFL